jgi:ubiquinone/menaquinone biosynthesis C-methylase UbiE
MSTPQPLIARLASLADPARLRLLALLESQELQVSELADILQMPQSTVSRHLKLLGEEGWIVARGEGSANLYRMTNGELPQPARALWDVTRGELGQWTALDQDRLRLTRVLAEREQEGKAFFAGVADEWDQLRGDLYGDRFTTEALLALLPRTWTVADLACGSGVTATLLGAHVERVIAVDASPEMLRAAKRRATAEKTASRIEFRKGDLNALPIDDSACDAALLLLALTHLETPSQAISQAARILKPGGKLVVVDLLRHDRDDFRRRLGQLHNGFAIDDLSSFLTQQSFDDVTVRPISPSAGAKGPALLLATGTRTQSQSQSTTSGSHP